MSGKRWRRSDRNDDKDVGSHAGYLYMPLTCRIKNCNAPPSLHVVAILM